MLSTTVSYSLTPGPNLRGYLTELVYLMRLFFYLFSLKLSAIAETSNFSDTHRLHVLFRQLTNRTPGEYRAMFKRK